MQTSTIRSIFTQPALAAVFALCVVVAAGQAGTINHGNFPAATVSFNSVTETSLDPVPIYGAPVTDGDTLDFFEPESTNPSLGFSAQSAGGVGDITDGFLNLTIRANPGYAISTVSFSEGGDYSMAALGSDLAQVSAQLNVFQFSITHVDGAPITPIVLSDVQSVTKNFPGDPNTGVWSLSSSFDVDAALAGHSYSVGATRIVAKVNNTLTALSQSNSVAGIFKKDFDIDVETRVPEPTTLILAGLGLLSVAVRRR